MNNVKFEELKKEYGERVVWKDESGEYCFSMGEKLMDDDLIGYDMDDKCKDVEGVMVYVGYGDDVMNCVGVKELSDIDKVVGLEEFIVKYVGDNCYSDFS